MNTIETNLTTVLADSGLHVVRFQEADRQINWMVDGLDRTEWTRPIRQTLTALQHTARQEKIRVFFMVANRQLRKRLTTLGFQLLGNTATGAELIGLDAKEPEIPTSRKAIRIADPTHTKFHRILMQYGFSFMVSSDLMVGREYTHPTKSVTVMLNDVDGEWEYFCLNSSDEKVYSDDDYTPVEQQWIETATAYSERLWRELYILLTVRPTMMTRIIAADGHVMARLRPHHNGIKPD